MFSNLNTEEFLKSNIIVKEPNLSLEGKKLNSSENELSDKSTTDSQARRFTKY